MDGTSDMGWNVSTVRRNDQLTTIDPQQTACEDYLSNCDQLAEGEPPRRYRIKKRHWQPENETLGDVLEQELLAWRDVPSDQNMIRRTLRSPTSRVNKGENQIPAHCNEKHTATAMGSLGLSHNDIDNLVYEPMATTSVARRSYFLEGSMTEASRGTASVWTVDTSLIASRPTSTLYDTEFESSTPRKAPSSRISLSSSIDINEFKPLPPTPTTFKATMKRLGHKLKPGDMSSQQSRPDTTIRALREPKKGLRKSISTWKFFDSTASEADDEGVYNNSKTEHKTIRNTASSRTLKLLNRHKHQAPVDKLDSVLDERKRKAEIAYAEQFGNSKKKQKQQPSTPRNSGSELDSTTVRRGNPTLRKPAPSERRSTSPTDTEAVPPPQAHSTSTIGQRIAHGRNSSRDSTSTLASDNDRRKRVSRSELEKENHHLRELLRQRDRPASPLVSLQQSLSDSTLKKGQDANSRESSPQRNDFRAALSSHPVSAEDVLPNSESAASNDEEEETLCLVEEVPPVPPLPPSLVGRGILLPTLNKVTWSQDTATVKRRESLTLHGRNINLPRPLSMVLEGLEDDNEEFDDDDRESTPGKLLQTDRQKASSVTKNAYLSRPSNLHSKENWEWPEDFF